MFCTLAVIGLLGCGCKEIRKEKKEVVIPVEVMEVTLDTTESRNTYVGTIAADKSLTLSFETGGCIKRILVKEGQKVSQGQLLAELDDRTALNAYNAAKVTLERAEDGCRRAESIYRKGSLPEVKWVEIQTQLNQARSVAEISKKNLENCRMYAPQSGTIGGKSVEAGMNVMPFQPVMQLLDMQQIAVRVNIPENEIAGLRPGQKAQIRVNALDENFEGKITEIGVVADPLSHAYPVSIQVSKAGTRLLPGMVCRVGLNGSADTARCLEVPMQAVQVSNNGLHFVWTYVDGKAHKVFVQTEGFTEKGVRVSGGLKAGDRVITEGSQKICENTDIRIQ